MINLKDREKLSDINNGYNNMDGQNVTVAGWVRNLRDSKNIAFVELNDGSYFKSTQVVLEGALTNYNDIVNLNIG